MKFKPLLYSIHRWLGIGMCSLFALWFASGVVMMYVEYPELTEQERIASLPALAATKVQFSLAQAASLLAEQGAYSSVKLTTVTGRPAWLMAAP